MATLQERLALLISADVDNAVRGLNKLERSSDRAIGKTSDQVDRLGLTLTKVGATMLSTGALAGVGLLKAAGAASDLNEAVNVTSEIFGDATDEMLEFGKTASTEFGQSNRAALTASAQFGGLLQNLGLSREETVKWSKDLTILASDLGSMFNSDPEEAVLALGSALRGESEPIRRFNVNLDDATVRAKAVELGLADTTAAVDNHGKAQGRLALIMEQTSAAQGDFARTSDGFANAQRTLKAQMEDFQASLGQALLPTLENVIGAGNDFLTWFNNLDPATQQAVSTTVTWSTGLLVAGGALSMATGAAIKARKNIKALTVAIRAMKLSTAATTVGVGLLAAGLVIAISKLRTMNTEVLKLNDDALPDIRNRVDDFRETLDKQTGAVTNATTALLQQEIAALGLEHAFNQAGIGADGLVDAFLDTETAFGKNGGVISVALQEVDHWIEENDNDAKDLERSFGRLRGAFFEASQEGATAADVLEDISDEAGEADKAVGGLDEAFGNLVAELLGSQDAHITAALLIDEIASAAENVNDLSYAEALAEVDALATGYGATVEDMVDEGRTLSEIETIMGPIKTAIEEFATEAGLAADEVFRVTSALDAIDGKAATVSLNFLNGSPALFAPGAGAGFGFGFTPVVQPPTEQRIILEVDSQVLAETTTRATSESGGAIGGAS